MGSFWLHRVKCATNSPDPHFSVSYLLGLAVRHQCRFVSFDARRESGAFGTLPPQWANWEAEDAVRVRDSTNWSLTLIFHLSAAFQWSVLSRQGAKCSIDKTPSDGSVRRLARASPINSALSVSGRKSSLHIW